MIGVALAALIVSGASAAAIRPAVITLPAWSAPSVDDAVRVARHSGVTDADLDLLCDVDAGGSVSGCEVSTVRALELSGDRAQFLARVGWSTGRMAPSTWNGVALSARVRFSLTVSWVGDGPVVRFGEPVCVQCVNQENDEQADPVALARHIRTLPTEAVRQGVPKGFALLRCRGDARRRLSECSLWRESPVGAGFGREALEAAEIGGLDGPEGLNILPVYFEAGASER